MDCITDQPQITFRHFERLLTGMISRLSDHSNSYDYVHAAVKEIMLHKGNISVDQLLHLTKREMKNYHRATIDPVRGRSVCSPG